MSDIEIIKALECCMKGNNCGGCCPYDDEDDTCEGCTSKLAKDALDLIKRQQREIERWRTSFKWLRDEKTPQILKEAKSEAYKEFAERLEDISSERLVFEGYGENRVVNVVEYGEIVNLVKELTEGSK